MTKKFHVYKSSAGSGKTYTLVKEFIKICFSSSDRMAFSRILAITFTNKAAAEMKERILSALESCANDKPADVITDAIKESGLEPEIACKKGTELLKTILDNYGSFSVSTIDRFSHRLIRNFTFDLKLPAGFDVTTDQDALLLEAVKRVIAQAQGNNPIGQYLFSFAEHNSDEQKNNQPQTSLFTIAKEFFKDNNKNLKSLFRNESRNNYNEFYKHTTRELDKIYEHLLQTYHAYLTIRQQHAEVKDDDLSQGIKGFPSYFNKLENPKKFILGQLYNGHLDGFLKDPKKLPHKSKHAEECAGKLLRLYEQTLNYLKENEHALVVYPMLPQTLFLTALIREVYKEYQQVKKDYAILPISEFNEKINELVLNETAPFIFERIGQRYNHIMIDEFQDTSHGQWMNFLPLVENAVSEGNECLLVGDAKQSIYRWRGAESAQFSMLPELPEHFDIRDKEIRTRALKNHYEPTRLITNRRSEKNIITFNNDFFEYAGNLFNHDDLKEARQTPHRTEDKGLVEFFEEETDEPTEYYKNACLMLIRELQTKKHALADIAILTRNNKLASEIAAYLIQHEINVISRESLLIIDYPKVAATIAFMQHFAFPENRIYLLRFIEAFAQCKPTEPLWREALENPVFNLLDWLASRQINIDKHWFGKAILSDKLLYLYHAFGWNHSQDPYLSTLAESVIKASESGEGSLFAFLRWWEKNCYSISVSVPSGMEAVQVMTIHKSKGLEFRTVIIPGLNWDVKNKDRFLWITPGPEENPWVDAYLINRKKALEHTAFRNTYLMEEEANTRDNLNLLYVAFTRASERLYGLMAYKPRKTEPKTTENDSLEIRTLIKSYFKEGPLKYGSEKLLHEKAGTSKVMATISLGNPQKTIQKPERRFAVTKIDTRSEEKSKGTNFHKLFACIKNHEDYLKFLISENHTSEFHNDFKEWMAYLFEESAAADILKNAEKQWAEQAILNAGGETFVPDRLLLHKNQMYILEIKTGKQIPKHQQQLQNYLTFIGHAGFEKPKGILVYTSEKLSIEL
ncbi:MAG: UvrD-helicase domain-containing protein [Bacteroidota bacterium]